MTSANLQGIMREFCSIQKLSLITDVITRGKSDSQCSGSSTSLEDSVRSYGQQWEFRENIWKEQTTISTWLLEEEPAQLAANLLGTDRLWLLRDQTYFKKPGSQRTPWHQDAMFIPVNDCTFLTLWIPLSPINTESDSPLEYWSPPAPACQFLDGGSAKASYAKHQHRWSEEGWTHLSTIGLKPGDCSFHDGWTLHGSDEHKALTDRLAFVAVYGCGEGNLQLTPAMPHAPRQLRDQVHLLRNGLHHSCFPDLQEGDPVPGHHNPWIRCSPSEELPIQSTHSHRSP